MRSSNQHDRLFPPIVPFAQHRVKVGGSHTLHVEQCGNPDGIPVLFLHGGPGAGISPMHRRLFDPELFHVILFDQRGAGQSTPFASTEDNTTDHLIDDIETIRHRLDISRWIVFGGSWGATLALAYGIKHPERCLGFVLRGIFLGQQTEIDWFLYGMARFYPEAWERFAAYLPENERDNLLEAYHKRLVHAEPAVSATAAESWSAYENSCATLKAEMRNGGGSMALSLARLEAHYFKNHCFLEKDHIIRYISRIARKPAIIVQGRHDTICPPQAARTLAQAWTKAQLVMVDAAGHSAFEPDIRSALISAMTEMVNRIHTKSWDESP